MFFESCLLQIKDVFALMEEKFFEKAVRFKKKFFWKKRKIKLWFSS